MTTHLLYLHVYECYEWMKIFDIRSYWVLESNKFYQIDIEFVDRQSYKCKSIINEIHIDTGKCKSIIEWKTAHNKLIKAYYYVLRFSDIVQN